MARTQRLIRIATSVAFLLLLLESGQDKANANAGGASVTVWDNNTGFNDYNNAPPLPPTTPLAGQYTATEINSNFDAQPVFNLYDDFIVRFEGNITAPITGDVRFYAPADDGVKFYLSDALLIDDWYDKGGGGSISQPVAMQAGVSQSFTLWFYENGGGAWVQLYWLIDDQWQIVPASAFSLSPIEPTTTTTQPEPTTTQAPTTTTEASTTTSSVVPETQTTHHQVQTTTTAALPSTLPSSVPVSTVPAPAPTDAPTTTQPMPTTTLPLQEPTSEPQSETDTQIIELIDNLDTATVSEVVEAVATILDAGIDAEQATELATNAELLETIEPEQAQEIFEALDIASLDPAEATALVAAVQDAPTEVREAFEEAINVFDGAVDSYVPIGSTVPISTRRLVIAAGALLSAVPVSSRQKW